MALFRIFLIVIWSVLVGYTVIVAKNHGMGLLPIFFGDMATMTWPGQFNLDFMFMLSLSALWVSWRHKFSGAGLLLGSLSLFGGALFLSTYLFIISFQTKGNVKEVLLGSART
ncbi:MAG: hypothetical protein HC918_12570 [Oscillatoriales cyanobacterium SM2_1_8]|nr:hypothetical protein [Oscillatoriales cyanobacterium SM2_1_8]